MVLRVKSLHRYPVKSLQGHDLNRVELDSFGVKDDRRYMLVDEAGKFITQRQYPQLSQVDCTINNGLVTIKIAKLGELSFSMPEEVVTVPVTIWGDNVNSVALISDQVGLLNRYLGVSSRLVFMPDDAFRQVDRAFFDRDQRVGFSDGFPVLLTQQASLDDLNSRLDVPIGMARFRPNIVIEGAEAYQEDSWHKIRIGDVVFAVVKPCSRCVMTTIENGEKGKEPLKTLATYRKNEYGVCFGQNLVQLNTGCIAVGDKVLVES